MYMVSEHESGYMCGFSVYTGKNSTEHVGVKCNTVSVVHNDNENSYGFASEYKYVGPA